MAVTGIEAMRQKYTRTFPKNFRNAVMKAMGEAAEKVVQDMRQAAPVYTPTGGYGDTRGDNTEVIPGALRASIGWTFGDPPKGAVTMGSVSNRESSLGEEVIRITVFAGGKGPLGDAFYARWVEHGTSKWRGKPFFYNTWRAHRRRFRSAVTRAMRNEIRKLTS